jgi:hypothetical protein
MAFWHRHLDIATAHLTALETARTAGLMAEDAEVEAAVRAEAARWRAITSSFPMLPHPRPPPELAGLADRVRRLAGQNDPDTMRTEIAAIAAALDALASPA